MPQKQGTMMTVQAAGQKGGKTTAQKHKNDDFYQQIGKKGGEARARDLGHEGYQELGHRGGRATAASHDRSFYQKIGQKGGKSQGRGKNDEF